VWEEQEVQVLPHMLEVLWVTMPTRSLVLMLAVLFLQQHQLEQTEVRLVLAVVTLQEVQVVRVQLVWQEEQEVQVLLPMLEVLQVLTPRSFQIRTLSQDQRPL
jgi:hypothetical protein